MGALTPVSSGGHRPALGQVCGRLGVSYTFVAVTSIHNALTTWSAGLCPRSSGPTGRTLAYFQPILEWGTREGPSRG